MAEFQEVMRQRARMCKSYAKCENCALDVFPSCSHYPDDKLEMAERIIMDWAAEHPEMRYPTWKEWSDSTFPDAYIQIAPCAFMQCHIIDKKCSKSECLNIPIPADIAQKLGIKPITKERVDK